MPFIENAYLGEQVKNMVKDNQLKSSDLYKTALELNKDLNSILYDTVYTEEYNKDIILLGLIAKIIQSYNSVIILLGYGLSSDSMTVLRSMLECSFNFGAIVNDSDYLEDYLKMGDEQTNYVIKNIEKHPEVFHTERLKRMAEEKKTEVEEAIKGLERITMGKLAKKAGMLDIYLYTYNTLSLETHGNAKAIFNNYIIMEDGMFKELDMLPKFDKAEFILTTAIGICVTILRGVQKHFHRDLHQLIEKYGKS